MAPLNSLFNHDYLKSLVSVAIFVTRACSATTASMDLTSLSVLKIVDAFSSCALNLVPHQALSSIIV